MAEIHHGNISQMRKPPRWERACERIPRPDPKAIALLDGIHYPGRWRG